MLHVAKPREGQALDTLVSATVVEPTDNERLRLAAVMRYEILDTPPEAACDRITALAADLFNVPISIIGFADRDRIWFKSHHGLDATEIGRGAPGRAKGIADMLTSIGLRLPADAKADFRSMIIPHGGGKAGSRFCIAVPLRTSDGYELGTLSVVDRRPIPVDARRTRRLETLAAIVMDQLEVRLASRRAAAQATIMAGGMITGR
jgi:GAF domain-containing protein